MNRRIANLTNLLSRLSLPGYSASIIKLAGWEFIQYDKSRPGYVAPAEEIK